jgi:hypothetical protein
MIIKPIQVFLKQMLGSGGNRLSNERQGRRSTLLIRKGGRKAITRARAIAADRLIYEYGEFDPPKGIECVRRLVSDNSNIFFQWHEKVVELAGKYVEDIFKADCRIDQGNDFEAFKKYLISFFQLELKSDIRLLCLIENESNVVLFVDHPLIIRKLFDGGRVIGEVTFPWQCLLAIRSCVQTIIYLLRGIFGSGKKN